MTDPKLDRETIGAIPAPLGNQNRAQDIAVSSTDPTPISITIETIDEAILSYLKDVIVPTIDDNGILKKVDVIYGSPERWKTARRDGVLRDPQTNKLLTPMIMIQRTAIEDGQLPNPNNKYMHRHLDMGWNNRTAYDKFNLQNDIHPSLKVRNVIIPDYNDLTYEVWIWTEYMIEMNTLIEQINVESEEYWGIRNNYKFRTKIDSFQNRTDLKVDSDRVVRTEFTIKVHGYLLPERMVKNFKISSTNETSFGPKKLVVRETITNLI